MQGLGNDFVVLDATGRRAPRFNPTPAQARFIAERHFGIGCDQILLVEEPTTAAADFRYRIFNADGSEVEQCGNGARCFVRFVHEAGLTDRREIRVETKGGLIGLRLNASFMQIEDRHAIRLRVWERGAGETLACGTGACAAVVAGIRRGLLDSPVAVAMPGGALTIAWPGINASVMMTGPAVTVFRGTIELPEDLQ
jgi:diaminopimelate epimerase